MTLSCNEPIIKYNLINADHLAVFRSIFSCGDVTTSEDQEDTLQYNCTDYSIKETFSILSFRYFGHLEGDSVYFHCDLRVCLAHLAPFSACVCPTDVACYTAQRKRRSVDESVVEEFHASAGPFYIEKGEKEEGTLNLLPANEVCSFWPVQARWLKNISVIYT